MKRRAEVKRWRSPQGFEFLPDDPETMRLLECMDADKHSALAHELALACYAGFCERWGEWHRFLKARHELFEDAASALRRAERKLRAARWSDDRLRRVSELRAAVEEEASVDYGPAVAALTIPDYYRPAVLRLKTKPPSWRPAAIKRVRALGIGRPTAATLVVSAAEAGRGMRDGPPASVLAAVAREMRRPGFADGTVVVARRLLK